MASGDLWGCQGHFEKWSTCTCRLKCWFLAWKFKYILFEKSHFDKSCEASGGCSLRSQLDQNSAESIVAPFFFNFPDKNGQVTHIDSIVSTFGFEWPRVASEAILVFLKFFRRKWTNFGVKIEISFYATHKWKFFTVKMKTSIEIPCKSRTSTTSTFLVKNGLFAHT